jgi:hypothetical protein
VDWLPTSRLSLADLSGLREAARKRGDTALSVILSGVELYVSLGREYELLEHMKQFADGMLESVENTPSAEELRRMFLDDSSNTSS